MDVPLIVPGGLAVDDRGCLTFANDFQLLAYKRFYIVKNHGRGFVRAWHGHRFEQKAVLPVVGDFLVCAVKIDDWENPSRDLKIEKFVLSSSSPRMLVIPPGYANGFMNLNSGENRLLFFSTSTLQESAADDIRFDSRLWDPWKVEER
jgi:dTDP-4-dehydrorhamnose 3,5-epimerase-like enzyme